MRYSLRLGRIFSIPLYWHWSFLPVVVYLIYAAMRGPGPIDWYRVGLMTAVVVLLFGFVLVHELGHALTARRFGLQTEAIIFFPLGGGALIRGRPKSSWREIGVYLAGPLSNLMLALLCLGPLLILPEGRFFLRYYFWGGGNFSLPYEPVAHLLALSLLINLVLFGLNLLPAYPLDGGRILQAMLRPRLGQVWATRIVASFGLMFSTVLWWMGSQRQDWFMLAGAFFIGFLSFGAMAATGREAKLMKRTVEELMRSMPKNRIYLSTQLAGLMQLEDMEREEVLPVFNEWNEVQGFLICSDALNETAGETVATVFDPYWAVLGKNQPLHEAAQKIIAANAYGGVVYERGRAQGYLLISDINAV